MERAPFPSPQVVGIARGVASLMFYVFEHAMLSFLFLISSQTAGKWCVEHSNMLVSVPQNTEHTDQCQIIEGWNPEDRNDALEPSSFVFTQWKHAAVH